MATQRNITTFTKKRRFGFLVRIRNRSRRKILKRRLMKGKYC